MPCSELNAADIVDIAIAALLKVTCMSEDIRNVTKRHSLIRSYREYIVLYLSTKP